MGIRKEELALYSLSLLEADERPNVKFSKENLAYAMDISVNTLNLYFTKLKNSGSLIRHKKKYYDDIRQTVVITDDGKKKLKEIIKKLEKEMLTPGRHNIPSVVPVQRILSRIGDPLEKIFFLSLYSKVKEFDLPFYLETIKTAKQDSNIVNIINNLDEDITQPVPIVETFFKTTFFGDIDAEVLEEMTKDMKNVNTLLLIAEASYKQGRSNEAMTIYDYLLSGKVAITQNQWFMARLGKGLLTSKVGDLNGAIDQLNELEDQVDNKVFKAYTKQVKARILTYTDRKKESIELFDSAIRSFRVFGFPLLLGISHCNRGIVYFLMDDFNKAEEDWNLTRKYSKESKSKYVEAAGLMNLADIEMLKGNLDKSSKYIKISHDMSSEMGDHERVAIANFNYALLELEKKNFEEAMQYFRKSETLAYPSPSPEERKKRREMFKDRAQRNGFPEFEFDE